MLILGIALAWAAPARAARAWEKERRQVQSMLASADSRRVSSALAEASLRAATPEAFAAEVVRVLADKPAGGRVSPATDALLRALFGRILQAMALGRTAPAIVVAASTWDGPVPQAGVEATPPEPAAHPVATHAGEGLDMASPPCEERPSIQAQGP
jgi:hypothetical protein